MLDFTIIGKGKVTTISLVPFLNLHFFWSIKTGEDWTGGNLPRACPKICRLVALSGSFVLEGRDLQSVTHFEQYIATCSLFRPAIIAPGKRKAFSTDFA